jgi:hypothetical protein
MMRAQLLLAACSLSTAVDVPSSWASAVKTVKQELGAFASFSSAISSANAGGGAQQGEVGDQGRSAGHLRSTKDHRAQSKVHLRSVLASEVGIVHKTEYWGKIFVGTPAKEFSVIFDTGSGNLILPSSKCNSLACNSHTKFVPEDSKTALRIGKKGESLQDNPRQKKEATIKFGTGKIHGQFYQDRLCLGQDSACMKGNFIGTDYESEMPFDQCSFDGIMGLGFKDLSMGEGFNMVDDVVSQHALPSNKFSVFITDAEGSEISFGGYKRSQAASDVLWAPVTRQSYWQIGIDDVTFNNEKTGLCSKCQVAVDSGTSLLAGPSEVVKELASKLNLKEDCSNFDKLPLLGFALGDKVLNLKPDDYVDRAGDACSLALMTLDVPPPKGPLFIFGDPFLRRFLTIYDRDGPRVGFAVAAHNGVTNDDAAKLIATTSESRPQATSAKESAAPPAQDKDDLADIDPLDAIESENLSWQSVFKAVQKRRRHGSTGMLQTTEKDSDELVTISLARTKRKL